MSTTSNFFVVIRGASFYFYATMLSSLSEIIRYFAEHFSAYADFLKISISNFPSLRSTLFREFSPPSLPAKFFVRFLPPPPKRQNPMFALGCHALMVMYANLEYSHPLSEVWFGILRYFQGCGSGCLDRIRICIFFLKFGSGCFDPIWV